MPSRALLIVDMMQSYAHEDADTLRRHAEGILEPLAGLIDAAREADAPVIYVNDSGGDWTGDRSSYLDALMRGERRHMVEPILPHDEAAYIVKARHSIFYETPLEYMLRQQEVDSIVLTGQVTEQCILYSALDAHIRHVPCVVPRDAVAHIDDELAAAALRMMEENMAVTVCDAREVAF